MHWAQCWAVICLSNHLLTDIYWVLPVCQGAVQGPGTHGWTRQSVSPSWPLFSFSKPLFPCLSRWTHNRPRSQANSIQFTLPGAVGPKTTGARELSSELHEITGSWRCCWLAWVGFGACGFLHCQVWKPLPRPPHSRPEHHRKWSSLPSLVAFCIVPGLPLQNLHWQFPFRDSLSHRAQPKGPSILPPAKFSQHFSLPWC